MSARASTARQFTDFCRNRTAKRADLRRKVRDNTRYGVTQAVDHFTSGPGRWLCCDGGSCLQFLMKTWDCHPAAGTTKPGVNDELDCTQA